MTFESVRETARGILAAGTHDATARAEALMRDYLGQPLDSRDRGMALGYLAEVLLMQGRSQEAEELFEQAYALVNDPADRVTVLCGYARLVCVASRISVAPILAKELQLVLRVSPVGLAPWGFAYLAELHLLLGDTHEAVRSARAAVSTAERLPTRSGYAEALTSLAKGLEAAGDVTGAIQAWEDAISVMQAGHCLMQARAEHARLALRTGDLRAAVRSLMKAVEFPDLRDRQVLARVLRVIRELGRVNPEEAWKLQELLASYLEGSLAGQCR